MSEPNGDERRFDRFTRFMLENFSGFLALLGIVFTAGVGSAKLDSVISLVNAQTVKAEKVETKIQQISVDLAVVKSKVETLEATRRDH